jgi:hypothetical protein
MSIESVLKIVMVLTMIRECRLQSTALAKFRIIQIRY